MSMDITRQAAKDSDARLRAALEAGDYNSVQLSNALDINKARNQVARLGRGQGGSGSSD